MNATETYNTLTELETKVMVSSLKESLDDYCTDAQTIASDLKLPINTIKGVVGSLAKKGLLDPVQDERGGQKFRDIFPMWKSYDQVSFGYENLEEEIIEEIKEWIKENE